MDIVQGALDVAGLAPVVGILADLTNAGISTARGNYADAALSMSAAVPLAGTVAGLAKIAKSAKKIVRKAVHKIRPPKGVRKLPFEDAGRLTEINKTLDRIDKNGLFPYARDNSVFRNAQGRLPRGNYREYTVDTPGLSHRGKRRIVRDQNTGNTYYTDDHYENFVQIDPRRY